MKKTGYIAAMLLSLLLLTACGEEDSLYGRGISSTVENGAVTALRLQTEEGEREVQLSMETGIISLSREKDGRSLLMQRPEQLQLFVQGKDSKEGFLADTITIESALAQQPVLLKDGTSLELWEGPYWQKNYKLDGQTIFLEDRPGGIFLPEDMEQALAAKLSARYDKLGRAYDLPKLLENAYSEWKSAPDKYGQPRKVIQETALAAQSEEVVYVQTYLELRSSMGAEQLRMGEAFRKSSGEPVGAAELFSCSMDRLLDVLFEQNGIEEATAAELKAAFRPELLVFYPDALEIYWPAGSMTGQDSAFVLGADIEDLEGLIQPWAVPMKDK